MQQIGFRTATALALILPALSLTALVTNVAAQDKRGGGAPAPHIAAPPPAPHISAPPPAPHIAAPPPAAPHISAPVAMPHVAPPVQHFTAPATHVAPLTPHINAPVHTAMPHVPGNVAHPNANVVHPSTNPTGALTRQQRIEERRIQQAHGNNPTNIPANGAKPGAKPTTLAAPNVRRKRRDGRVVVPRC